MVSERLLVVEFATKLTGAGIFTAFGQGKVPSNKQIDIALNSALAHKSMSHPSGKLSEEGRKLVGDLKNVIEEAKYLLLTKNDGNLIQDFIWKCQQIDAAGASRPGAPVDRDTARQQGNEALDGLKVLARLVISNGQFRKLLSDASVLARDMAGDAATTAAQKVNPSEDRLRQIDEPAEDNTWHDAPDLSRDNIRNQARSAVDKNKPMSREDARDAARDGRDTAQNQRTQDNQQAGHAGASSAMQNLRNKADANTSDETKDKARQTKDATVQHTRNYMEKKIPKERRDQTIWRLKKMIVEIQGHSDCM